MKNESLKWEDIFSVCILAKLHISRKYKGCLQMGRTGRKPSTKIDKMFEQT